MALSRCLQPKLRSSIVSVLGAGRCASSSVVPQLLPRGTSTLFGKHVLAADQFDRSSLEYLFDTGLEIKNLAKAPGRPLSEVLRGYHMAPIFFEPSTRTKSSFVSGFARLGGTQVDFLPEFSSQKKGETFEDTIRMFAGYCDVIVCRHPEPHSADRAAAAIDEGGFVCPVLNAGDGPREHPTQTLLDLFTMKEAFGKVDDLRITLLGDLKFGRTVHSMVKMLTNFSGITVNYVAPKELAFPDYVMEEANALAQQRNNSVKHHVTDDLKGVLAETDVLYVTRIQQERFKDPAEYQRLKGGYTVDKAMLDSAGAPQHIKVLHPLPRVDELSTDLDTDPRGYYFTQATNGMYARMALLTHVMCKN